MRRAIFVLYAAGAVWAQQQGARPAYVVASVKLNDSADGNSGTDGSPGQVMYENMALTRLIAMAYGVQPFQVSGPGWLESEHFDITAKYQERRPASDAAHAAGGPV
jgi:uncharacterized protein (TIGR03435 family)